ncbi:recombinase family protein [Acetanaerobacterium elongatum]|uniref:recombinase family protein n=1 Tax=Acetanaerobacterium elongatum TaxID=258515 RepID=UPI000B833194|nr:recombinase family protein [Acetanaerobacterium elongatum]
MNSGLRAAIYARYSTNKQDEISIEAQVRACREYAAGHGHVVVKVYSDEAISGKGSKTTSRKQYQALIKDCANHMYDIVLVHKYDRIARNVGEHVNLELKLAEGGASLIAVAQDFGQSKEAKIMKTMMWALSEYYIDNLSEEVTKGHKEIAFQGLHNGGVAPFGYDIVDQKYIINQAEAVYVRKMFRCAINREGFVELVREMDDNGIIGKRGKPMKYTQIYEILRNEKYAGVYAYSPKEEKDRSLRRTKPNAIRLENAIPPIVDKATFDEVQRIMDERKQTGKKSDYLCRGLVYCGNCGAKMYGSKTQRKGHEYLIYYCSGKCGMGIVRMEDIDRSVKQYLHSILSDKNQKLINEALQNYAKGEKDRIEKYNADVRQQIEEKQTQIDNYMRALGSSVLPTDIIADIGNKITVLKNSIKELSEAPLPKDYTIAQVSDWLQSLKISVDERKTVELLVSRIEATKTEINVFSTLNSVLGETGCGGGT